MFLCQNTSYELRAIGKHYYSARNRVNVVRVVILLTQSKEVDLLGVCYNWNGITTGETKIMLGPSYSDER